MVVNPRALALVLSLATSTICSSEEKIAPKPFSHLAHIVSQAAAGTGVRFSTVEAMPLTPGDLAAIADSKRCPAVVAVAPVMRARTEVTYKSKKWVPIYIYGTTPEFLKVREWEKLVQGKLFAKEDVEKQIRVCLLGKTLVAELFGDEDPIGKEVRLQNVAENKREVGRLSRFVLTSLTPGAIFAFHMLLEYHLSA